MREELDRVKFQIKEFTSKGDFDQVAKLRYAISDEEYIAQAVSIAVAINDTQGRYIGSLYTTAPKTRKSVEDLIGFVPDMQKAADDIRDAFFGEI